MISLLLASSRADDRPELEAILPAERWRVVTAQDVRSAVDMLRRAEFPIVLCDRDLSGGKWTESIRMLVEARERTCVILISGVSDEYLWTEVVHNGGFDVVTRPYRKEQVIAIIEFAHNYWKTVALS